MRGLGTLLFWRPPGLGTPVLGLPVLGPLVLGPLALRPSWDLLGTSGLGAPGLGTPGLGTLGLGLVWRPGIGVNSWRQVLVSSLAIKSWATLVHICIPLGD